MVLLVVSLAQKLFRRAEAEPVQEITWKGLEKQTPGVINNSSSLSAFTALEIALLYEIEIEVASQQIIIHFISSVQ